MQKWPAFPQVINDGTHAGLKTINLDWEEI